VALFDTTTLLLLLDPSLPAPLDKESGRSIVDVEKRISYLVGQIQEDGRKIVVPTPVLAEVLTRAERAGADYFTKIDRSSAFRIEAFEIRAAIELARMTAAAIKAGDKKEGSAAPWAKIKFDRQIVAIAKVNNVSTIYSDDDDLRKFATAQGISVVGIIELPLPPEGAQMVFTWDVVHDDKEAQPDE
jgi:predicted nucleic acid-binding protein